MDTMSSFSNALNYFLTTSLLGIPLWLITVFFVIVIWFLYARLPKESKYKRISLEKEVKKDMDNLFDVSSFQMGNIYKNYLLRIGFNVIGNVNKAIIFNWNKDLNTLNPVNKVKNEVIGIKEPYIFYGFKVNKNNLMGKFGSLFGRGKYFLVDKEYIEIKNQEILINPSSQFTRFLGIMIFSQIGSDVVSDVAFKKTTESILEEQVNFIPKMTYLELKRASSSAGLREITNLEKEKYDQALDKMIEKD